MSFSPAAQTAGLRPVADVCLGMAFGVEVISGTPGRRPPSRWAVGCGQAGPSDADWVPAVGTTTALGHRRCLSMARTVGGSERLSSAEPRPWAQSCSSHPGLFPRGQSGASAWCLYAKVFGVRSLFDLSAVLGCFCSAPSLWGWCHFTPTSMTYFNPLRAGAPCSLCGGARHTGPQPPNSLHG